MTARNIPSREFIASRSIPEPNTGCWLWLGALTIGHYGHVKVGGRLWVASRLSYTVHVGPVPGGMFVCHRCDTRQCVNPDHLFLGTNQDNMDDMRAKGRGPRLRGDVHPRATLTNEQVRRFREIGMAAAVAEAAALGIDRAIVTRAVSGRSWACLNEIAPPRPARKLRHVPDETKSAIRDEWSGGAMQKDLVKKYGVSAAHVSRIVHGIGAGKVVRLGMVTP